MITLFFLIGLTSISSISSEPIVYGRKVPQVEYPFLVHLAIETTEFDTDTNQKVRYECGCGGTIITGKSILTAAHCLTDSLTPPIINVYAGVVKVNEFGRVGQTGMMDNYIIHEEYETKDVDIAFIYLKNRFTIQRGIVEVATLGEPILNRQVTIMGWGTIENDKDPNTLRKGTVKIVPNIACGRKYVNSNDRICLWDITNKKVNACTGDSGTPAVFNGQVVGVAESAFTRKKKVNNTYVRYCSGEVQSIYMNVKTLQLWIIDNRKY